MLPETGAVRPASGLTRDPAFHCGHGDTVDRDCHALRGRLARLTDTFTLCEASLPLTLVLAILAALLAVPMSAQAQGVSVPVITTTSPIPVVENETAVATLTATDDDTSPADLTWSIPASTAGGADAEWFTLSEAGNLAFTAAKDYETPPDDADTDGTYEVTVQVSDGTYTDTADLAVTLENVTELTTITGPATVTFAENSWTRVATFTASSEEDRDGIAWTLAGADHGHFSIDSPAGALRFDIAAVAPKIFPEPPDFEAPADSGSDNAYTVILVARVGTTTSSPLTVTVTVTDVDEAGGLSLSTTRPALGAALTATLTDPDGVTAGSVVWQWERSTGRNAWAVIDSATAASYTPVAADTNAFLRVTATYDDEHGSGHIAQGVPPHIVLGPLLSGLTAETESSPNDPFWELTPTFGTETLHYRIGCADADALTLAPSAASGIRIAVDGTQVASGASISVPVDRMSEIEIVVSDGTGAQSTYVVHCIPTDFPTFTLTRHSGATGIFEELLLFSPDDYLLAMDNEGVPRFIFSDANTTYFRFTTVGANGEYRYSYNVTDNRQIVLDADLNRIRRVGTAPPLTTTAGHDQRVLDNENALLMAYEPTTRYMEWLSFPDENGDPWPESARVRDSAIQIVTPAGTAVFTWNSWLTMALQDCVQHRFPDDYAHVNSLQMVDGIIIASLRGCGKVLALDPDLGSVNKVAWRLGQTNLAADDWAELYLGPPPLDIVNDPEGEFCGQHAVQLLPNGHLIMFDNGAHCVINPWTREVVGRNGFDFSRALEYAIDLEHQEAVFVRDHSLHGTDTYLGFASGHVELLANGDWLINWGKSKKQPDPRSPDPSLGQPIDEMWTQVDPATGQEKLAVMMPSDQFAQRRERPTVLPAEALAPQPEPLTAEIADSDAFHTGSTDRPKVVVAFNQAVVDFNAGTPSVTVQGATVTSVASHIVPGDPANAYLFTLTPMGASSITFNLVADQSCASGGVCTADGTLLSEVPASHVDIPAGTPSTPMNLEASASDGMVTLGWTTPYNGGNAITKYQYQEKVGSAAYGSWTDITGSGATTTSHTFTGLTNGTLYAYKVRAVNALGNGAASDWRRELDQRHQLVERRRIT